MSYSIREGLDDAKARVKAYEAILARFPDATLDGRDRWTTDGVGACATDVDFNVDSNGELRIQVYVEVKRARVYERFPLNMGFAGVVLDRLKEREPAAYAALVRVARGGQ